MGCAAPSPLHWSDLRAIPRKTVLEKPGVSIGFGKNDYRVDFLKQNYRIDPDSESVEQINPATSSSLSQTLQILLIGYLLTPGGEKPSGNEITEKELPGGATFFRGPHQLPTYLIADRFGRDAVGFETRGKGLGGKSVFMGDRAIRLTPFPHIPVTLVLWLGDDEFDASVSAIFDRSIQTWFEPDMVYLLVGEIVRQMCNE